MKKKLIAVVLMLAYCVGTQAFAAVEIPGGVLDRAFDEGRTLYYVELNGDIIPDIDADGYTTLQKAEEFFQDGTALTKRNTTVIENSSTGQKYRFVFTRNTGSVAVSEAAVSNDGVLTVKGKVSGNSKLKVFVLRTKEYLSEESYAWNEVDRNEMEKTVLNVIEVSPEDITDDIIIQYTFPESAISGTYGLLITGDAVAESYYNPNISYTAQADLDRMLTDFNAICAKEQNTVNAQELAAYIDKYYKYLYLDLKYYNQLSDEAKEKACLYMFREAGYKPRELNDNFCKAVSVAWANDSGSLSEILAEYNEYFELELYEDYTSLKSSALIASNTKNADSIENFRELFNNAVALQLLNEAKDPKAFGGIMESKKDYLGISEDKYDKYLANKDKCIRAMINKTYTSASSVESAINTALSSGNGSAGGSTGGTNSGSSASGKNTALGYKPPVTSVEKEPDSEIKTTEKFPFTDCENYSWAENAIEHMYKNKIISGRSDTEFCPQDNVTREEFVKIIVNSFGFTESKNAGFEDVNADAWYKEPIDIANAAGIINGISETEFGVGKMITREDMAVIIYRAVTKAGLELDIEIDNTPELSDLDTVSEYARSAVDFLISKGAVSGYDGKFHPKAFATRAEAAQMIYQIIKIR